jgi:hypothetical protein
VVASFRFSFHAYQVQFAAGRDLTADQLNNMIDTLSGWCVCLSLSVSVKGFHVSLRKCNANVHLISVLITWNHTVIRCSVHNILHSCVIITTRFFFLLRIFFSLFIATSCIGMLLFLQNTIYLSNMLKSIYRVCSTSLIFILAVAGYL